MGKVAVVVVHGIGSGTGEERCAFSESLKKKDIGSDPIGGVGSGGVAGIML